MDTPTTSSPFPGTSFVILSVSIVGILATSLLLLAYYLFLTRCGLLFFWRPGGTHDDDDVLAGHHHRHVVVTVHEPAPRRRSGLEEAAIRRIPTFRYRHGHLVLAVAEAKQAGAECAVCLADFRDGERLRVLPPCLHAFHIDCIDAWLQSAATCPLCRAAVSDPAALHYRHLDVPVPVPRAATDDIVIDVIGSTISPSAADDEPAAAPSRQTAHRNSSCRMGGGDGCFLPMRRSLSMDSSTDKRFYLALQSILRQSSGGSPAVTEEEEGGKAESSNAAAADTGPPSSRRLRRSFFSFSQSRGSRSAVLPL
jgi:hypothetical protein